MEPLIDGLRHLAGRPLGCAVHVGAGTGTVLPGYDGLLVKKLCFIEGDSENAARLRSQTNLPIQASVRELVVGASARELIWNRYSLASLNGPLDAAAWTAMYPRLRLESSLARTSVPLAQLLSEALEVVGDGEPNLLVLDVAGQEALLLRSIDPALLQRFEWVAVRSCAQPPNTTWNRTEVTLDILQAVGYTLEFSLTDTDPVWPVHLLRFDVVAHRVRLQEARIAELEALLAAADEHAAVATGLAEKAAATERASRLELETRLEALAQAKAVAEQATTEQAAALREARTEHAAALDQAFRARDESTKLSADRDALATERTKLIAERDALSAERTKLAAERDGLAKEKAMLVQARDEQTKAAREAKQRLTQVEGELAELGARYGLLQEELVKAEAQIELIADLLLREPRT
jgi:hypothetical protein